MQAAQRITLTNGLRVNLIHDPDASRAAALIQLSAGSHDGPRQWPGLAHLLEHVLFAGSEQYQDEQRLMAWGPANGARLNATTLAHHTAWFFEIVADKLEQGVLRLVDMLTKPLLTVETVRQEVKVIDAEFSMLTRHTDTLCEAALSQAFAAPHRLHDFHVGNRAAFGDDSTMLQQALLDYHQRFFRAENLEMWIHGPQPVASLFKLAEQTGAAFQSGSANGEPEAQPLTLTAHRHYGLQLSTAERLQIGARVAKVSHEMLAVLQELLTDTAERSLLATLRELGLVEAITLREPYRSAHQSAISLQFELCDADDPSVGEAVSRPAAVEAIFCHWLQQLAGLNEAVLCHYAGLAQRRFAQLSALDQLRTRAFGYVPPAQNVPLTKRWQTLLAELQPEKLTALWVSSRVVASPVQIQGFTLHTGPVEWPSAPRYRGPEMGFYAAGTPRIPPFLPSAKAPLRHFPAACQPVLLLNPSAGVPFTRRSAALVEAALQPVIGQCLHQGGELRFAQQQGIWLLQLSATPELLLTMLAAVIDALSLFSPSVVSQGERRYHQTMQSRASDIAIRVLLARLPELVSEARVHLKPEKSETVSSPASTDMRITPWQATLYGGALTVKESLSRLLSRWPGSGLSTPPATLTLRQNVLPVSVVTTGEDAALLLFCPLLDRTAECLAAWQLLAALYEPAFFQRLRVELNIGYVVSCRFHHSAGEAGMLFALQSPTQSNDELERHMVNFIRDMADFTATISEGILKNKSSDLINSLPSRCPKTIAQCQEHWQQQQLNLPELLPSVFAVLTPEIIRQYAQRLATETAGWLWLSNRENNVNSCNK